MNKSNVTSKSTGLAAFRAGSGPGSRGRLRMFSFLAICLLLVSGIFVAVSISDDDGELGAYTGGLNLSTPDNPYSGIDVDSVDSLVGETIYVWKGGIVSMSDANGASRIYEAATVSDFGLKASNVSEESTYTDIQGRLNAEGTTTIELDDGYLSLVSVRSVDRVDMFIINGDSDTIYVDESDSSWPSSGCIINIEAKVYTDQSEKGATFSIVNGANCVVVRSTVDGPGTSAPWIQLRGAAPGDVVVRATSVADPSVYDEFTVHVIYRPVTKVNTQITSNSDGSITISASCSPTNAHDLGIDWSFRSGSSCGSIGNYETTTYGEKATFTPTSVGVCTIRMTASDGNGAYKDLEIQVNGLTFNLNGGSGNFPMLLNATTNSTAFIPTPSWEPTKTGYAFMGWGEDDDDWATIDADDTVIARGGEIINLNAFWGLESQVRFHVQYGSGGPGTETVVIAEGEKEWFTIPNGSGDIPVRPGYTFLGWSKSPGASSADYSAGGRMEITAGQDYDLYDVWAITENEYHLVYDANGGVNPPATQDGTNYGVENTYRFIVTSSEPTYAGYKFQGWSTIRGGEVEYHAGSEYYAPIGTSTLYAVWQKINTFTIAYDANGGQGAPQPETDTWETVDSSVRIIISTVMPTWDEFHRFTGWSLDPNAEDADISPGAPYTLTNTGTTTFYAVWEEIEGNVFTLHLDLQGGLVGPDDVVAVTVQDETDITIPSDIPTWDEYRLFLGWSLTKGSEDVDYSPGERIHMDGFEKTLYAVWQRLPMPWTLHFDLKGGQWESSDQTGTSADYTYTFVIPDVEPTYEGFGFRGWAVTDGGEVEYHPGEEFVTDTQESTLYAVWEELSLFTLSFNVNGGSEMEPLTGYGLDDCTFTIPSEVPVLEGKLFEGWTTMEGGAVDCQPGQTITVTFRNTVLHAVWVERPSTMEYVLRFDVGDGSGGPNALREIDSADSHTFTVPAGTPVRDGFGFMGWSLSQDGEAEYHAGDTITVVTLTTTLYAVWINESLLNTFTLRFDLNGGTGDIDDMTGTSLEGTYVFTIPSEIPERDGFAFVGWAVPKNPSEVAYHPGEMVESSVSVVTLYAVWQPEDIVFTLSFYGGDGATDVPIMMTGMAESNVHSFTIPSQDPVMDGFVFVGWSPEYGGDAVYMPGEVFVSGVRDATLYAVWEVEDDGAIHIANVPTDRIDAGSQFTWEVVIDADVPFTVTIGGSAAGWLNVNNHTVRGTPSTPGTYTLTVTVTDGDDYYPSTESYTIRVMEHDMEYRVEFVTSGGTQVDEQWIQSGGSASVPEEPVRDGFRFGGWYTPDGSKYDFATAVGADMTLRALWISDGSASDADDGGDDIPWTLIAAGIVVAIIVLAVVVTRLL